MKMKGEGFLSEFFRTYSDIIVSLSILKESFLIFQQAVRHELPPNSS